MYCTKTTPLNNAARNVFALEGSADATGRGSKRMAPAGASANGPTPTTWTEGGSAPWRMAAGATEEFRQAFPADSPAAPFTSGKQLATTDDVDADVPLEGRN